MKWRRGLCAAGLAVVIGVTGAARPAHAAESGRRAPDMQAQVFGFDWVGAAILVAGLAVGGGGGGGGLDAAVQEIKAAVDQAKNDIIAHTDAIAAAEVKACVRANTIEFTNINSLPPPVLILWAQSATSCATLASAYLQAMDSKPSIDELGFVLGPIYAIAVSARAKAGLVNGLDILRQEQIRGYEAVAAKLVAECTHRWEKDDNPRYIYPVYITCTVYPGKVGEQTVLKGWPPGRPEPPISYTIANQRADELSSRSIANDALPRLRAGAWP
ncbi:hypothetical protein [Phytohabitans suffuscus]|uniref:Uncharacterized protein n=1 Tax=Phytohabitans suffuscus TaxID=624315 RepID=A0A6F8YTN5_9ACTN|nr:hypothetical protein [Phytohabitans suffuscus]BCB89343.1 hypothetical protein Psuf_066560 [Phytohabitans suffuscus]